jgi:branched-chain amino acid transport system permease protein
MLVAGVVLILLTIYARRGIMGLIREKWLKWLP